jgi:hypothetical protein
MHKDKPGESFPVVCIGGSAGGLPAYLELLLNLPAYAGMAFVIVPIAVFSMRMDHDGSAALAAIKAATASVDSSLRGDL